MRNFLILFFFFFITCVCAELGARWPTSQEMAKAPVWPLRYSGNPLVCIKVNEKEFLKSQEENGYKGEEEFTVDSQIDLNLDGTCEVVAFQKTYCGNKQCGYVAFQLQGKHFVRLGDIYPDEFLVPLNGWLQVRGYSYSGDGYALHLIQYMNGSYRYIRTDKYKYDEKTDQTKYIESEYYK